MKRGEYNSELCEEHMPERVRRKERRGELL